MKSIIMKSFFLALLFTLCVNISFAQVGPVVSVSEMQSNLPEQINSFLNKFFPKEQLKSIELKTMEKIYEIDLINGYDLKFRENGDLMEIDAPKDSFIGLPILNQILPAKTYEFLVVKKIENNVKEFSFDPIKGYKIEVGEKDYYFDPEGKHIRCNKDCKEHD